jgi:hypothetical protein
MKPQSIQPDRILSPEEISEPEIVAMMRALLQHWLKIRSRLNEAAQAATADRSLAALQATLRESKATEAVMAQYSDRFTPQNSSPAIRGLRMLQQSFADFSSDISAVVHGQLLGQVPRDDGDW